MKLFEQLKGIFQSNTVTWIAIVLTAIRREMKLTPAEDLAAKVKLVLPTSFVDKVGPKKLDRVLPKAIELIRAAQGPAE